MKALEAELSQYKRMYAELAHENYTLSITSACAAMRLSRSTFYRPVQDWRERDAELIDALNAVVIRHPRWVAERPEFEPSVRLSCQAEVIAKATLLKSRRTDSQLDFPITGMPNPLALKLKFYV